MNEVVAFIRRWPMFLAPGAALLALFVFVSPVGVPEGLVEPPPMAAPPSPPTPQSTPTPAPAPRPVYVPPPPIVAPVPIAAPATASPAPTAAPRLRPAAGEFTYEGELVETMDPGITYHEASEATGVVSIRSARRFGSTLTAGDHSEGRIFDAERVLSFTLRFGPSGEDVSIDAVCAGGFPILPAAVVTVSCDSSVSSIRVTSSRVDTTTVRRVYGFSGDVNGTRVVDERLDTVTGLVLAWRADGTYDVSTGVPFAVVRFTEAADFRLG